MQSVLEYIASEIPYAKQVRETFRKKGIFVDTREEWLLKNLQLSHLYKDLDFKERLSKLNNREVKVGSWLWSKDEEFELGRVSQLLSYDLMTVHFNKRELKTMCNSEKLITAHDKVKRKLKVIY